jgi:hypothetical protein
MFEQGWEIDGCFLMVLDWDVQMAGCSRVDHSLSWFLFDSSDSFGRAFDWGAGARGH